MKAMLVVLFAILITGCVSRMGNDVIIAESMKCEQAGLPWRQTFNYDGTVSGVFCMPHSREPVERAGTVYYPAYQVR